MKREPIIKEADEESHSQALIADLAVRGVWQPQAMALLDIRVTDTDAQSYGNCSPGEVLIIADKEKKESI